MLKVQIIFFFYHFCFLFIRYHYNAIAFNRFFIEFHILVAQFATLLNFDLIFLNKLVFIVIISFQFYLLFSLGF